MSLRDVFDDREVDWPIVGGGTVAFIAFLVLPLFIGPYEVNLLTRIFILAFFAMSFNLAFGFTDLPSFGHAAFFGLGAYGVALVFEHLEPGTLVIPVIVALLAALVFSLFMGIASLRGRGIYFALLTFAFAQFLYEVVFRWTEFTGGDDGLIVTIPDILGIKVTGPENVYYISLVLLALLTVGMYRVLNSPFGKVMGAIRENDDRTSAIGYPVKRVQLTVFALSGTLASIAGILQTMNNQFVSTGLFFWQQSVDVLVATIIGGSTTLVGPIIGAFFLVLLREGVRDLSNVGTILIGVVFILIILLASDGIVGMIRQYLEDR
ncbi:branched-chain amino acid ABC transporter permease [Halomarina halobia]|uniref:Branched-chain amino acid ABC transporter permease n=1 Tax=Halomarina halobia TaxID=3033386 RepID=A0ABD6AEY4_9EURY|nr:branched-chain amino acid ABC transporter permease [Halomarina sp. PSR21]